MEEKKNNMTEIVEEKTMKLEELKGLKGNKLQDQLRLEIFLRLNAARKMQEKLREGGHILTI